MSQSTGPRARGEGDKTQVQRIEFGKATAQCAGYRASEALIILMPGRLLHSQLGELHGCRVNGDLIQFRSLPYAQVPRRFARSILLDHLPRSPEDAFYQATEYGPCSIQSLDSIDTDVRWNQLPGHPRREQEQSEDCLRLTLTCPTFNGANALAGLPVVVFVHGGALMIGSGNVDPT